MPPNATKSHEKILHKVQDHKDESGLQFIDFVAGGSEIKIAILLKL